MIVCIGISFCICFVRFIFVLCVKSNFSHFEWIREDNNFTKFIELDIYNTVTMFTLPFFFATRYNSLYSSCISHIRKHIIRDVNQIQSTTPEHTLKGEKGEAFGYLESTMYATSYYMRHLRHQARKCNKSGIKNIQTAHSTMDCFRFNVTFTPSNSFHFQFKFKSNRMTWNCDNSDIALDRCLWLFYYGIRWRQFSSISDANNGQSLQNREVNCSCTPVIKSERCASQRVCGRMEWNAREWE